MDHSPPSNGSLVFSMLTMISIFSMVSSSALIKMFSTPSFYSSPSECSLSGWTIQTPPRTKGSRPVLTSFLVLNVVTLENAVLNGFTTSSGSQIVRRAMKWERFGFQRRDGGYGVGGRRGSLVEWLMQCRWWTFSAGRLVALGNLLRKHFKL